MEGDGDIVHCSNAAVFVKIERPQLVEKSNTTSEVWRYFGFQPGSDGRPENIETPVCKICFRVIPAKASNTSNLYAHLKSQHPHIYIEVKGKPNQTPTTPTSCGEPSREHQPTMRELFQRKDKFDPKGREHRELTKAVTYCITKDRMPLNTISKPGFQHLLGKFNPRYELPSKNYFSRVAIPSLYAEVRKVVEKEVRTAECFATTVKTWTSRSNEMFLTFSLHSIDGDWNLKSHCLQTQYLPDEHTGKTLKCTLEDALEEWALDPGNLVAVTTDKGPDLELACELLGWRRIGCFSQNLQRALLKGLEDSRIERIIQLSRQIFSQFSRSWRRKRDLSIAQGQKGLPRNALKTDIQAHWVTTLDMLERFLEQQDAVRAVLAHDRKTCHLVPTWQDIDVLESVIGVLRPFREMTEALSSEKFISISVVNPLIKHICNDLVREEQEEVTLGFLMRMRIKRDLEIRYGDPELVHFLEKVTFIDPRFGPTCVDNLEGVLQQIKEEVLAGKVIEDSSLLLQIGFDGSTVSPSSSCCWYDGDSPGPSQPKKAKYGGGLAKIFGKQSGDPAVDKMTTTSVSLQEQLDRELDFYFKEPKLSLESCPLQWWKATQSCLPLLAKLAKKYLCISATSVPSESAFSSTSYALTDYQNSVKPKHMDQLVFLSENLP
ncbi:E3 SUMO-protein ligase ZBED1 [Callorhinchus milii]|uniref:E3 SUMO-protein ligase ZBED1 n=1 Tax=Callorhinchus milii TaxID=7868 RepID=UPI000457364B|nr:E3 SUMO-protein ligase ZBED1 [Callorhinchus milii]XP_007888701.1 E3 SUMO-protein ligase ZBED1 [Callorhinchus milii]|eukprot:gi/632946723/ref/XP_007888699.1/ PREDICTED: zinc finger BED domain-containing protein 1-like [Callorhinchus milii]